MLRLFLVVFILGLSTWAHSQVVINEIQSSNGITVDDEDGHSEDWVELYNAGTEPVNLDGYWLSDDYDNPSRWIFPDVTIGPGDTLLVWASNKNRRIPGSPLHTNFAISAGGEEILLSAPDGELLDEVPPIPIPTDVSWGRSPDGADNWVFFAEPTPGASNTTQGYNEILEPPTFSAPGGFYSEGFELTLSHPDPEVTIIYTLDASEPDAEHLGGTTWHYKNQYPETSGTTPGPLLEAEIRSYNYAGAIDIVDRAPEPNVIAAKSSTYHATPDYIPDSAVYKGTPVRARAFKDGAIPSPIATHTYFISDTGENIYSLPIISLNTQEDWLFAYEDGIHVAGSRFEQWRADNPFAPADGSSFANWQERGREWERRTHIELFEPGSTQPDLRQDIGLRIHGGWSRAAKWKSLRLYSRNAYGESRFNYPIFPQLSDDRYNRLILRNSGNDRMYTLFRDAMIQSLVSDLRIDIQEQRPVVVFINGEYNGLRNIRERYDRHYLERAHGVDADNLDILDNHNVVSRGSAQHYIDTIDYIADNSLADDSNFEYVQTRIDTDNYMDFTIANIFANNTDWPGNNVDYWRLRTDEYLPGAPYGHDGRWRWMLVDTDFGFGLYDGQDGAAHNTLIFATAAGGTAWPNPDWATFLLRNLLENESYKLDYVNRFADLLNTNFKTERVVERINAMKAVLEPEVQEHIDRWGHPSGWGWSTDTTAWNNNVQVMIDFAETRPGYQRQHIESFFGMAGQYQLTLDTAEHSRGKIRVNSITITEDTPGVSGAVYPWQGTYFHGAPIELEAVPEPGYEFSHWEGVPADQSGNSVVQLDPDSDISVTAHFSAGAPPFLHAWVFDSDMPNNTPLEEVVASVSHTDIPARIVFHSALAGYPFDDEHDQWRNASMERRNRPTPINYRLDEPYGDVNMRGLQVRQPFTGDGGENTLIFELPTSGHSNAIFRFAAMDEGAADSLLVDYSVSEGTPAWTTAGLNQAILPLSDEFQLYSVNFSGIATVNDNPNFKVRIRFAGENMAEDDGDRVTFNNITLDLQQNTELAYFWLFDNDLPNNTELETIAPTYAALPGGFIEYQSALPGYPDTDRKASLERRNDPTDINYLPEGNFGVPFADVNMRAIQVRQPFTGPAGENTLIFRMPTTGMSNLVFRFAAMDEGAAQYLRADYAVNAGQPQWTTAGLGNHTLPLTEDTYQLYELDFSDIAMVDNNPHFKVRLRFGGQNMAADDGDRVTFNNISLQSLPDIPDDPGAGEIPVDPDNPNAPVNNRFAYAHSISGASGSVLGSNESATLEAGEPDHSEVTGVASDHSVWWTWTAPETERVSFSAGASGFAAAVTVYSGSELADLVPMPSVHSGSEDAWFVARAGETYKIAVSGVDGAQGDVALVWDVQEPAAPPMVVDTLPGEPGISCEVLDCILDGAGNLMVGAEDIALFVFLPDQSDNPEHHHQLQLLNGEGESLWSTEFGAEMSGVLSRVIADTQGLPVVVSSFTLDNGNRYQIEAYPDGLARHRVMSPAGEQLRVHLAIAGSDTRVNSDSVLTAAAELNDQQRRVLLQVNSAVQLLAQFQQHDGDSWSTLGDLLTDTEFPAPSVVRVLREDGVTRIEIESLIDNDLYF